MKFKIRSTFEKLPPDMDLILIKFLGGELLWNTPILNEILK